MRIERERGGTGPRTLELGAYPADVYHALSEAGCEPHWVSGVSIGAINASIIAGNKPEDRLARLKDFWDLGTTARQDQRQPVVACDQIPHAVLGLRRRLASTVHGFLLLRRG
ncbi:MAG TPA: patatin-like phospholipase family protein [Stellaceae bacterium]|nr:patatin-like phospholipase family protein [Stellaceae bacterium]